MRIPSINEFLPRLPYNRFLKPTATSVVERSLRYIRYFLILTNVVDPDPLDQGQDLLLNPDLVPDFRETKVKDLPVKENIQITGSGKKTSSLLPERTSSSLPAFQIRDILIRIWLWNGILGSVPLTSGSCYFRQWPSRCQHKFSFSLSCYAYSSLKVHLHHSSKIKIHKEVTKQYKTRFFFIFCLLMVGSGSVQINYGSGSRRPTNIRLRIRNTALHKWYFFFRGVTLSFLDPYP